MGILTRWDNREQTMILLEFESEWTWADLEAAIEATDRLIVSVAHPVDILIDLEGSRIPRDFLSAAQRLLDNPEPRPNEGRRIVIGVNGVMKAAYSAIQKAFGGKLNGRGILFASNLDDARIILRDLRASQPS